MCITSDMLPIVNALHKPQCQVFFWNTIITERRESPDLSQMTFARPRWQSFRRSWFIAELVSRRLLVYVFLCFPPSPLKVLIPSFLSPASQFPNPIAALTSHGRRDARRRQQGPLGGLFFLRVPDVSAITATVSTVRHFRPPVRLRGVSAASGGVPSIGAASRASALSDAAAGVVRGVPASAVKGMRTVCFCWLVLLNSDTIGPREAF
jgi:hypothetical protein